MAGLQWWQKQHLRVRWPWCWRGYTAGDWIFEGVRDYKKFGNHCLMPSGLFVEFRPSNAYKLFPIVDNHSVHYSPNHLSMSVNHLLNGIQYILSLSCSLFLRTQQTKMSLNPSFRTKYIFWGVKHQLWLPSHWTGKKKWNIFMKMFFKILLPKINQRRRNPSLGDRTATAL